MSTGSRFLRDSGGLETDGGPDSVYSRGGTEILRGLGV